MDPESRWQELERIFHAALSWPREERDAFLRSACEHDEGLRRRVDSLLRHDQDTLTHERLDEWDIAAQPRIGPYKVVSKLGSGGMGDVYLAFDTRLERNVALKILPGRFADDRERRSRFLRETKIAATLNHPNIVAVYDVGSEGANRLPCHGICAR